MIRGLTVWTVLTWAATAWAQSPRTEHTLQLDEGHARPTASIEDVKWLAGAWTGEAFGGVAEETWNPPSAGTMVGLFKLISDGRPAFYELQLMVEEQGSLVWKVKHFDRDFGSWEDKADFASFPLVKLTDDTAWFEGLTLQREAPDRLVVYLAMTHAGEFSEEKIVYRPAEKP